ncbi:N-terminal EF-hand calcium-binding protein 1-like [Lytechinus pictus]|uniref:N-terminal EF-hand calcium-binding protein 1-like n=1 Tax=Lytechinus pictus TaxID=7653 RepID=UPI0030BA1DA9
MEKGMAVFQDVFRRADKNDDNCLSLDEFKSYFGDGILTAEELEELFNKIDTHNTSNIDVGELCEYFSANLGPFKDIFGGVEDMSAFVSQALQQTAQVYPDKSFHDQFTVRVILKEISGQLSSLMRNVDAASDHMETEAMKDRAPISQVAIIEPVVNSSAGWVARRARRQLSSQTSIPADGVHSLTSEVNRLADLVTRLEQKVKINPVDEEIVSDESKANLAFLVSRKFTAIEERDKAFRSNLRTYVEAAGREDGCTTVSVRAFSGTSHYVVYEIWESEEDWKSHFASESFKIFRRENVDLLDRPEQLSSMAVPAKWIMAQE